LPLPPGFKTGLNRGQPKSGLPLLNGDKTRGSVETGANERRGGSPSKMGANKRGRKFALFLVLKGERGEGVASWGQNGGNRDRRRGASPPGVETRPNGGDREGEEGLKLDPPFVVLVCVVSISKTKIIAGAPFSPAQLA